MNILIAEDEPISNLWLKTILTKWGHDVISTRNGREAWDVLRRDESLKLVLLDWEMPEMKGIEVCEKARRELQNGDIYIILVTGNDMEEYVQKGFRAGANDYIMKPFDKEVLRIKLSKAEKELQF